MKKTVLITGATDGIGLETARRLGKAGHRLLIHGRNPAKLDAVIDELAALPESDEIGSIIADLSDMRAVDALAQAVSQKCTGLDVLINNAGIFKTDNPITAEGLDIRFVVNTLAPYRLTKRLAHLIGPAGRIINLSSAAQAPVNLDALAGKVKLDAMSAYSQSKLAITMWSRGYATLPNAPIIIAVNPGSMLGSKMVKEGFGVDGGDLSIGAEILCQAALSSTFESATGQYYDNDSGKFAPPHADALDPVKIDRVMKLMDEVITRLVN